MTAPQETGRTEPEGTVPTNHGATNTVMRNTMFLMVAQVISLPLSMLINVVMARKLGPEGFGYIYLATNLVTLGFLVVEWGQSMALTALIAKNHSLAGTALGTGVSWRLSAAVVIYGVLMLVAKFMDYDDGFYVVLSLVVAAKVVGTVNAAFLDTARGLERSRPTAVSLVRYNILSACLLIPTLYTGGGLYGALIALIFADLINTTLVFFEMRSLNIGAMRVERPMLNTLLKNGTTFMLLGLALNLQPNVDSTMLARLATPEAIGWYAAARKLIGLLIFPVVAMIGALYPTLCRLHAENITEYCKLVGTALRVSTVLVMPIAIGVGMFPELGIKIFSEETFGPAEDNLRILSSFVLLVYITMVLGSAISAARRERAWTVTQFACIAVSAIVDPILVPWFHINWGNGGLGVCVASVLSEVLMLICGIVILPREVFDRAFARGIGRSLIAGAVMIAAALACARLGPFVGAPVSVIAYGATVYALGGIDQETIRMIMTIVKRKR